MPTILVILMLFIGVFFIVSGDLQSDRKAHKEVHSVKSSSSYHMRSPEFRQMSFDIGYIRGDGILYIDRRVFRESLKQHLAKEGKFRIKYNPFMEIDFRIHQKIVDKKFYRALYKGNRQYRVKKKLIVRVEYAIYNSKKEAIFRDDFTYKVIMKSGSTISYQEADHKLHRKLFWILGKIVAKRLNRHYKEVGSRVY